MKEYKVTWMIELDADSPEDAANKALEIQKDENSTANYFVVEDEFGNKEGIETGSVTLDFTNDEEPSGFEELMDLLESISDPESNVTPVYLTVEMFQSVVSEVNAYQSEMSAKKAEQEWLEDMDIIDICDREIKEQNGTSFQIFVTNLLP